MRSIFRLSRQSVLSWLTDLANGSEIEHIVTSLLVGFRPRNLDLQSEHVCLCLELFCKSWMVDKAWVEILFHVVRVSTVQC